MSLAPWHTATTFALAIGAGSAIGIAYSGILSVRVLSDRGQRVELDDKICHGIVPPVVYAMGIASAIMFYRNASYAAAVFAIALLMSLAANIRNAWDLTLFMARQHTAAKKPPSP